MLLMSPKVDFVFKRIFGSERNKHLLISFLNAVFDGRHSLIVAVELKNTDNGKDAGEDKFSRLDVKAVTETGKIINIEIQRQDNLDMIPRSLYYAATMIHEQLDGKVMKKQKSVYKNYHDIKPVVSINIVDFNCTKSEYFHSYSTLTQSDGQMDLLEIHFFELPKFEQQVTETKSLLECWLAFINQEETPNTLKIKTDFPELQDAAEELKRISLDKEERALYNKRIETLRNEYIALSTAYQNGLDAGIEIGIEKGREEVREKGREKGREEEQIKTILRLVKKGLTKEDIMDMLDCTDEVYEKAVLQ